MHAIIFKRINRAKLKVLAEQTPAAAHCQMFFQKACSNLVENALIKILPRISVGGISMVSVCLVSSLSVCAVVDGSLDLSLRATSFFNGLGHDWRC